MLAQTRKPSFKITNQSDEKQGKMLNQMIVRYLSLNATYVRMQFSRLETINTSRKQSTIYRITNIVLNLNYKVVIYHRH